MMNSSRSMNDDFIEGQTDRKYKKVEPDRGGVVEATTYASRKHLNDAYFGIHEAPNMTIPDGRVKTTPYYIGTPAV